jgi:hypothetical protein
MIAVLDGCTTNDAASKQSSFVHQKSKVTRRTAFTFFEVVADAKQDWIQVSNLKTGRPRHSN